MKFVFEKMTSFASTILIPLYVFLLCCSTETAATNGTIPAVIAFGDSILDTGNNNNLLTLVKANVPPYGKDFPGGKATGRFCNGKVFSDLIAEGLGVKDILPAYLDPNLQDGDLPTGVCFASAGSGLDPVTATVQFLLSITDQLNYFKEYITKLKGVVGEEKANAIISNTLFLVSSGNNDIAISYYGLHLKMLQDISSYTSQLVTWASDFVKDLYDLGARKIAFLGTLPLGCLPVERTLNGGLLRVCNEDINRAAQMFNSKLSSELSSVSTSLASAKIFFIDVYNPLLALIQNPGASGFEVAANGCCGTGTIEAAFPFCNTFNPFTCSNTANYVFWDSAHPTERAYRIVVSQILQQHSNFSP